MTAVEPPISSAFAGSTTTGWRWMLAYGVIVILIGFLALMNPLATGLATGLFLAAALIVYGIAALISAASSFAERGRWVELALGLLALAAGVLIFFTPYLGALSLVWATGAWLFVSGVLQISGALHFKPDRWWRLLLGLVDVVLGIVLLFAGPWPSLTFLALMVGISFLFKGVFLVTLALGIRRIVRESA